MVQPLADAVRDALDDVTNEPGMCLRQVQAWYEIPARYPSAAAAWRHTRTRRLRDRTPPRGAPVWWTGGSHGAGHVAMALGDGTIRSTDVAGRGRIGTVDLDWPERSWGLLYMGSSADLEAVTIPELLPFFNEPSDLADGDVLVHDLHFGTIDSDSVRRLQYMLNAVAHPPGSRRLPTSGNYLGLTDSAVRDWQWTIGDIPDPERQSSLGPLQAAHLFPTPPYRIIEDSGARG